MSDQNQSSSPQNDHYVNSYVPPSGKSDQSTQMRQGQQPGQISKPVFKDDSSKLSPDSAPSPFAKAMSDVGTNNSPAFSKPAPTFPPTHANVAPDPAIIQVPEPVFTPSSPALNSTPIMETDTPPLVTSSGPDSSESLEEQNIFELLGVADGSDEEKEEFLDELQQVIWEDFLENDVELLVTLEEKKQVDAILAKTDSNDLEKQEELVVYLEKLIPDLEEIMLEKALELK